MLSKQHESQFVKKAMAAGWLDPSPVSLIDVGASGGIEPFWNQFRPHLKAVGFDPLVNEVDRLNALPDQAGTEYVAAFVGDGRSHEDEKGERTYFDLTSAARAAAIESMSFIQQHFNSGMPLVYSDTSVTLDTYFGDAPNLWDVLKVDTDSYDFFVLDGGRKLITEGQLLFVECECQFQTARNAPEWPTFAEIDVFMRKAGYRLVNLECWNYSRAALPGRFIGDFYGQTTKGQISYADALYVLDHSFDAAAFDRLKGSPSKFGKSVILAAALGHPDIAADMLVELRRRNAVPMGIDVDAALDWLVPDNPFGATSYEQYKGLFEKEPARFKAGAWDAAAAAPEPETPAMRGGSSFGAIIPAAEAKARPATSSLLRRLTGGK